MYFIVRYGYIHVKILVDACSYGSCAPAPVSPDASLGTCHHSCRSSIGSLTMSSQTPPDEPPPAPRTHRSRRHGARSRGYSQPRGEKSPRRRSEVKLLLCVFHSVSHNWSTEPLRFDPHRIDDRELWTEIRSTFRQDLQKPWKRLLGFKKVKSIVPIGVRHLVHGAAALLGIICAKLGHVLTSAPGLR